VLKCTDYGYKLYQYVRYLHELTSDKNSIAKLWFLSLFDKAGNIDYTVMVPEVTVLVQSTKNCTNSGFSEALWP